MTASQARHAATFKTKKYFEFKAWLLMWFFIFFAIAIRLENNGPFYPLRTRQTLQFKQFKLQHPWEKTAHTVYVSFLKHGLDRNLLLSEKVKLLANSKVVADATLGEPPNSEIPHEGRFLISGSYVLYTPNDHGNPESDAKAYELYFPPAMPAALEFLAISGAILSSILALGQHKSSRHVDVADATKTFAAGQTSLKQHSSFRFKLIPAIIVLALAIYFSTGSLTPYNLFGNCYVRAGVPYFTNCDHFCHKGVFDFLNGQITDTRYLRRILFPLLFFPAMKLFGYETGGLVGSILLNMAAPIGFAFWCKRKYGERAGILSLWLLATFPGIMYFAGLPYLNSFVVPASLAMLPLLSELDSRKGLKATSLIALLLGLLNLGYDMLSFFAPVAVGILLTQKRFRECAVALICMLLPTIFWISFLWFFGPHSAFTNENTSSYANGFMAYTMLKDPAVLRLTVEKLPTVMKTAITIFFASGLYFLPGAFLLIYATARSSGKIKLLNYESFLLLATMGAFLFLNCAPDYVQNASTWQLKGDQFARIYEPVFIVYISYIVRVWQRISLFPIPARALVTFCIIMTMVGNGLICFGPILGDPFAVASRCYHDFYMDAPETYMQRSIQIFGRRPLGFFHPEDALKVCSPGGVMPR